MSHRDASWQEADPVAEDNTSVSPASPLLPHDSSSDSTEPWTIPVPPHYSAADSYGAAARVPPLSMPAPHHPEVGRSTKLATTVPPDTPELAEAGPSAPAYASRKPPRPFSRPAKQYDRSNLGDTDHVPVNWIGDSTDHAGYRPANTASFSNHEPDIVRVATFSTQGQKHDDAAVQESKPDASCRSSKRRWPVWALLGVVSGTAIGVAYKLLGDRTIGAGSAAPEHPATAYFLSTSQVVATHQSKTISDDELVQYLVHRRARKVSQT
ncbi:hypothetical protein ABBQ38_011660 [Trebouxia sp. C0009 RCD-2024]